MQSDIAYLPLRLCETRMESTQVFPSEFNNEMGHSFDHAGCIFVIKKGTCQETGGCALI